MALTSAQSGWVRQSIGSSYNSHSVSFINSSVGIIISPYSHILRTTDGGATWIDQTTGYNDWLMSSCLVNGNIGFVVGRRDFASYGTFLILRTTDGGATWTDLSSLLPIQDAGGKGLFGVSFVDVNHGWVVGGTGPTAGLPVIFRTTDGGSTWANVTSGSFSFYSVSFSDTNNGIAVGYDSYIFRTTNGGSSWKSIPTSSSHYNAVCLTDANIGTIVGLNGIILHTTNGGSSWIIQSSGTNNSLYGLSFPNANTGFAVGENGTILSTTDAGAHWMVQSSGTTATLRGVCFTDSRIGTIVGDSGIILRTTTGGLTEVKDDHKHDLPNTFRLEQNYPNPFNPMTTISFSLPSRSIVSLQVFDMIGREVATIVSEEIPAGNYTKQWNAGNMSSGIYFYRLQAGPYTDTKILLLLK
jgi:photosystem II stability/assembly factor-like uncharacterized protein